MKDSRTWMVLSLFITCLISAFALSQVYNLTLPQIEYQRNVAGLKAAFSVVFPEADRFEPATPDSSVWFAYSGEKRVGSIIKTAKQGYGGPVPVTAGIDLEGKIIAIKVASSSEGLKETPGLGLKATEPDFRNQFAGKTVDQLKLKKDGGPIEAITGATITSRAVTDGLREALEKYRDLLVPVPGAENE
jgi:electron transport complex protein RnfG|uniref:Ion-translocating oxidoreductase complex subunit G n=1 Tax=candidate division WOR-3 bacterium TaxID=2052148 RepID=A0A7V3PUF1_UNCW3